MTVNFLNSRCSSNSILDKIIHQATTLLHLKIKLSSGYTIALSKKVWNRSEKFDHLAYNYWYVLQGSGIINMIRNVPYLEY